MIPIQGESKHLHANAELAVSTGIAEAGVVVGSDGVTIDLVEGKLKVTGRVSADLVFVDGQGVGTATEETLHERRALRDSGVITALAIIDPDTNELAEDLELVTRGLVVDDTTAKAAGDEVVKALAGSAARGVRDVAALEELVERAVSRAVRGRSRREPVVIAIVVDA